MLVCDIAVQFGYIIVNYYYEMVVEAMTDLFQQAFTVFMAYGAFNIVMSLMAMLIVFLVWLVTRR